MKDAALSGISSNILCLIPEYRSILVRMFQVDLGDARSLSWPAGIREPEHPHWLNWNYSGSLLPLNKDCVFLVAYHLLFLMVRVPNEQFSRQIERSLKRRRFRLTGILSQ
jgi:hypothetical protein